MCIQIAQYATNQQTRCDQQRQYKKQASGEPVRSSPAANMVGYEDLSDFHHWIIVCAWDMKHSILEVAG